MTAIPKKVRAGLAEDPFYRRCCVSGDASVRGDRIEWHHNLIYAGKQVQEPFAILPLKKSLHDRLKGDKDLQAQLDWIMWNRATDDQIERYSKAKNYTLYRATLNGMFGKWVPDLEAKILGYYV